MPPKKRSSQTRSTNPAKRPRLSRGTESREGSRQEDSSHQFPPDQLMTVNITALPASISSAVKQAVVEALAERSQPSSGHSLQAPIAEQSVADAVGASLASITQDSTVQGAFSPSRRSANSSAREPFAKELVSNLESLSSSVLSSRSCQSHRRAWTLFREFHTKFYKTATLHLPLSTSSLALFISFLDARKMAPTTILSYLSAIGFVHKMRGLHDPVKAFKIQKLLTSISRRRSSDVRLPISKPILHDLANSLEHTNSSAAQRILFSTMFLTVFYGFFRIGDLAAKSV